MSEKDKSSFGRDYISGDKVIHGDVVHGDKVGGNKVIYQGAGKEQSEPESEDSKPAKHVKKVLAVFSNPIGSTSLRLGAEDRAINECITRSRFRDNLLLKTLHAATIHDVRRAMLEEDYQIIHFSGHGIEKGLVFEDSQGKPKVIPPDAMADFLDAYSPPLECALLNACYSLEQAKLITGKGMYIISMDGPVYDESAIEFTRGFYDAIGAGRDIAFAFDEGVRATKLEGTPCNAVLID